MGKVGQVARDSDFDPDPETDPEFVEFSRRKFDGHRWTQWTHDRPSIWCKCNACDPSCSLQDMRWSFLAEILAKSVQTLVVSQHKLNQNESDIATDIL